MAFSLDLETYERRRTAMLALLKVASGLEPFGSWLKHSDSIAARRNEKLDTYLDALYMLLDDVLRLTHVSPQFATRRFAPSWTCWLARFPFDWLRAAVTKVDALMELVRRNIQKSMRWMRWPSICARNESCEQISILPIGNCAPLGSVLSREISYSQTSFSFLERSPQWSRKPEVDSPVFN